MSSRRPSFPQRTVRTPSRYEMMMMMLMMRQLLKLTTVMLVMTYAVIHVSGLQPLTR